MKKNVLKLLHDKNNIYYYHGNNNNNSNKYTLNCINALLTARHFPSLIAPISPIRLLLKENVTN